MSTGTSTPDGHGPAPAPSRGLPGIDPAAFGEVCPHLGMANDAGSRCTYVTDVHRCYRGTRPRPVPADVQRTLCLSSRFGACPIYQGVITGPTGRSRWFGAVPLPATASIAVVALLLLAGVLFFARSRWDDGTVALPSPAATGVTAPAASAILPTQPLIAGATPPLPVLPATPSPSPSPSPVTIESPRPPAATQQATPAAPPAQTGSVAPPRPATYVVQPGDSISAIAARFGLDAVALSQLNGIPWNATIFPGEVIRLR